LLVSSASEGGPGLSTNYVHVSYSTLGILRCFE